MSADIRYVRYHAWWTGVGRTTANELLYAYVAENLLETWIPADRSQDWLLRRTLTGRRRWLVGDESATHSPAYSPGWPTGEWRAPYGDFYAADAHRTPAESPPGRWSRPNPAWLDELPRDPESLLDELRAAVPSRRRSAARLLHHARQALHTGQLPADLVVALFHGLAGLSGVTVKESVANLDGRLGTALVAEDGVRAEELIIDSATGEFLGERTTLITAETGLPAGTVTGFTSMSTARMAALGDTP